MTVHRVIAGQGSAHEDDRRRVTHNLLDGATEFLAAEFLATEFLAAQWRRSLPAARQRGVGRVMRNVRSRLPGKPPRVADVIPPQFELAQVNISRLLAPLNGLPRDAAGLRLQPGSPAGPQPTAGMVQPPRRAEHRAVVGTRGSPPDGRRGAGAPHTLAHQWTNR